MGAGCKQNFHVAPFTGRLPFGNAVFAHVFRRGARCRIDIQMRTTW